MESNELGKTSTGIQANVSALLCYLVGWISGLVFFLIEKENKFVRFHALQSVIVFGAFTVLSIALTVTLIGIAIVPALSIIQLVLWIVLMVKGFQGQKFKLPIAGDIAEKNS